MQVHDRRPCRTTRWVVDGKPAATAGGTHQVDLGLSSIPPGEYLIEITVKGASGENKTLVPLRVVS